MSCLKCTGYCVEEVERDSEECVVLAYTRCLNCGWRTYQPRYQPRQETYATPQSR